MADVEHLSSQPSVGYWDARDLPQIEALEIV